MSRTIVYTDIGAKGKRRIHKWLNTETLEPMYGIQINAMQGRWYHAVENDTLLIFSSEADARAKAGLPALRPSPTPATGGE